MHAGRMRERASFWTRYGSLPAPTNEYGEPEYVRAEWGERWVELIPAAQGERVRGVRVQHEATHVVRMRYSAGISTDMQMKIGTRTFEIIAKENVDERSATMVLQVIEATSG
jgi:head-tail adaptor